MTDIRKHGFESDAQWREYLQEIEEAARPVGTGAASNQDLLDDLADLRAEVAALRERVKARFHRGRITRWQSVVGAAALLLLAAAAGR